MTVLFLACEHPFAVPLKRMNTGYFYFPRVLQGSHALFPVHVIGTYGKRDFIPRCFPSVKKRRQVVSNFYCKISRVVPLIVPVVWTWNICIKLGFGHKGKFGLARFPAKMNNEIARAQK